MEYREIGNSGIRVSRVGLGGHYRAMEEGNFEDRYAYVAEELDRRTDLVSRAIEAGITYFDTTWRNEVDLLGVVLARLGAREKVVVNGMILGAFTGPRAAGVSVEEYFNKWLDYRLGVLPGHSFDALMINAIEEGFNDAECERLLRLMEARRSAGDFKLIGLSSHNPAFARQILDRYPQFQTAMVPYNFHNRAFEQAFDGYTGSAALIAMKSLVWLEYGLPFCAINALEDFEQYFGFVPAADASTRALRFIRANPRITSVITAVNSYAELANLVSAGEGAFAAEDAAVMAKYRAAIQEASSIPLYLGGMEQENLRMNYFAALHLSRVVGVKMPDFSLNKPGELEKIRTYSGSLKPAALERWRGLAEKQV